MRRERRLNCWEVVYLREVEKATGLIMQALGDTRAVLRVAEKAHSAEVSDDIYKMLNVYSHSSTSHSSLSASDDG